VALTKVAPALFGTGNNITSVTVGGSANTISLTFDASGVITSASNNALLISNTAITGNIISSQITSVANTQITGNIISSQISPSVTLTTPIISGNLNLDSAGTTGIRVPSANTIAFYGAGTEKVRIDSSGNMGIGITPPAWAGFKVLDVGSVTSLWAIGSGAGTSYYSNNLYYNGGARIYKNTGEATEYTQGGGTHQWYIASSGSAGGTVSLGERMRINASGYFKATNADYPDGADTQYHYFNSNISAGGSDDRVVAIRADSGSFAGYGILRVYSSRTTTNGTFRICAFTNGNGSGACYIADSGNVTNTNNSYGSSSDVKLKENIVDTPPKLNDLMKLRVRNYNLKIKPDEKHIGLIAQEAETVFPGLIEESIDYHDIQTTDENGKEVTKNVPTGTTTKSIKYSVFVPMLIKAMQEQQELITAQAATINALTARIDTQAATITALTARVVALES
jgi:hypothetical protein